MPEPAQLSVYVTHGCRVKPAAQPSEPASWSSIQAVRPAIQSRSRAVSRSQPSPGSTPESGSLAKRRTVVHVPISSGVAQTS